MESYELRINELMSSVCRYRDLAKMWEQRWQEQQSLVEQGRKGQHDLIIIISLKKVLIANICRELGGHFNETVSEPDVLAKIKLLI